MNPITLSFLMNFFFIDLVNLTKALEDVKIGLSPNNSASVPSSIPSSVPSSVTAKASVSTIAQESKEKSKDSAEKTAPETTSG